MATTITSECINCGACEPECPNTAIYAGGVPWKTMAGEEHPAIAQDIFYIVPSKCTECVGFFDHEACAAVCPVDCCVPDPKNVESEAILLARARELHPDKTIADDAPSRFRKEGGGEATPAAPAANGDAAAAAPKAAAPVAAAPAAVAAAPVAMVDTEYNPSGWEVPVICKDCNEPWMIPYRHFQAGVVLYCPSCSGSYVPKSSMVREVRETFEGFYNRRRAEREALARRQTREAEALTAKQEAEMEGFKRRLAEMAQTLKPAGKQVKPKGIAAMFT
ncbi:MAG TPA: 4Fe-4S dicluster domain-containing protein [Candidatus Binataceae bacterium]|nr:4Fe-4S dicluster domain-containing protein [Candidatus Binataceae bacterium]